MSATSGCNGCYGSKTEINTINQGSGASSFKAKIVEKEKSNTWWEHTFELKFEYCEAKDASDFAAKQFGSTLNGQSRRHSFSLENCVVNRAGNTVTATVNMRSESGDAAEAERAAGEAIKSLMFRNQNLIDGGFKLASEQKQKVTKYDVWDSIDRYV